MSFWHKLSPRRISNFSNRIKSKIGARIVNTPKIVRASRLINQNPKTVVFVTSLLRAREIKMATALRKIGWKVILIYLETTPFLPDGHFDETIRARSEIEAHLYAKTLEPRVCHVFSGAVDGMLYRFCTDKPGPVIVDMNDVFCSSLFDYCHERFQPTKECLEKADGLCARDLQAKSAERFEGFRLPRHVLLFPEYSSHGAPSERGAKPKLPPEEVHVVSVGTFCLETLGMYDSAYLKLAEMLTQQQIHLHIYPHWFYRQSKSSVFNFDLNKDFADFFRLQEQTPYLHIHESLPLAELAQALPQYDFGIIAGGSPALGQKLRMLKPEYMKTCYSGRISDYLDARLPVIINPEVEFNFWLLKRYDLVVDLDGLQRIGFKDQLLTIKRDRAYAAKVDKAAQTLSLEQNIDRLAAFYTKIIDDVDSQWLRIGYPLSLIKSLPFIGKRFRQLESGMQRVSQSTNTLQAELMAERREAKRKNSIQQGLLQKQRDVIDKLQWRLDNSNATLAELTDNSGTEATTVTESPLTADASPQGQGQSRSIAHAKLSLELERGSRWADELSGLLNWPEIRDRGERENGMPELLEMLRLFSAGTDSLSHLSSCWQVLGFKNFNQLLRDGYRNFKRTVGSSYFNFLVQTGDEQISFLEKNLSEPERKKCAEAAAAIKDDPTFEWHDQRAYRYFVMLLWTYTRKIDTNRYLNRLIEPEEGNPLVVPFNGERASQDLANSVLEYYSMTEIVDFGKCKRVLEIGGGYGRDAYVIMGLNPHIQYTMVDIPPALWIAQRYLSSVFPKKKIFSVRDFQSYDEVRDEMERASIVFLLPHQIKLLPAKSFDLTLNISSFGEMQPQQIRTYLEQLEIITDGYFYMKQWKVSQNAFDNLSLTEASYPFSPTWKKFYSRTCKVQSAFFESAYRTTTQ